MNIVAEVVEPINQQVSFSNGLLQYFFGGYNVDYDMPHQINHKIVIIILLNELRAVLFYICLLSIPYVWYNFYRPHWAAQNGSFDQQHMGSCVTDICSHHCMVAKVVTNTRSLLNWITKKKWQRWYFRHFHCNAIDFFTHQLCCLIPLSSECLQQWYVFFAVIIIIASIVFCNIP